MQKHQNEAQEIARTFYNDIPHQHLFQSAPHFFKPYHFVKKSVIPEALNYLEQHQLWLDWINQWESSIPIGHLRDNGSPSTPISDTTLHSSKELSIGPTQPNNLTPMMTSNGIRHTNQEQIIPPMSVMFADSSDTFRRTAWHMNAGTANNKDKDTNLTSVLTENILKLLITLELLWLACLL